MSNPTSMQRYCSPASRARAVKAVNDYAPIVQLLKEWSGVTQMEIAQRLNDLGFKTREGREWTNVQVRRVMKYMEKSPVQ